jgi:multidrug efflux pump subunit AcrB
MISDFFIRRPIVAMVIAIVTVIVGLVAMRGLPVAQLPNIVPPQIIVSTTYTGADAVTIEQSVSTPLEQQMNGVEDMLYMFSHATSDGRMTLTITFALGTNLDTAQVQVQNRVAQALPRLPQEVQRIGLTTEKASPDIMMAAHLVSPDERYDRWRRHVVGQRWSQHRHRSSARASGRGSARRRCSLPGARSPRRSHRGRRWRRASR